MSRRLPFLPDIPKVCVVQLQGPIGIGPRGLSDATVAPLLEKAFRAKPDAVALQISSPGGSPVQSSLIGGRIRRLADERKVPVVAFVEDVAASGGYWLAAAADEIYADASSVVGSIGVISAGFGAQEFIARHGIERRIHTSGRSKSFLDPFRPEKPEDVERLERLLEEIHEHFVAHVTSRRGAKLAEGADLFTGEFWTGARAKELGLVDGIGHLVPEMKRRFGPKTKFRKFGQKRSLFQRLGAHAVSGVFAELDERAAYARFGL
ncbi:peptidase, family S49 [Oceanicola granulosus HTCC2516]|uniref:Peptidase, family S49 n=1 Tax=Oceanicola granulosus (strain ATCC BAA-861 / DSM 15982 / KCTC 12143 / HTCC2516) TaxID=314256 RepID=Q2CCH9_OCEGH|nr:S49 family peptidase [Oceanicola granulosus]EAR50339.1 peptidase, family S49 [Oceanicola granulosus HTCC2516]